MSRAFRFDLEPVLDLRARQEDERAQELAEARRREEEARRKRELLLEERRARTDQIGHASDHGESVGRIRNLRRVLDWLDDRIHAATTAEEQASVDVAQTRDAYTKAVRDRMSIDRLKDRRRQEWDASRRRLEQKELDEVASTRHEAARRAIAEETR